MTSTASTPAPLEQRSNPSMDGTPNSQDPPSHPDRGLRLLSTGYVAGVTDTQEAPQRLGQKKNAPSSPSPESEQQNFQGRSFETTRPTNYPSVESGLPEELWLMVNSTHALFSPNHFLDVTRNLLKNPNNLSSHLFRAEIFYDSQNDPTFEAGADSAEGLSSFVKHMKAEYRPRIVRGGYPGYRLDWTIVRKLIPRNPQLDKPLVQTCHLFTSLATATGPRNSKDYDISKNNQTSLADRYLVIYIPHAASPEEIPWYHPAVHSLAILYTHLPTNNPPGELSLFYNLFPGNTMTNRLERTALNMLKVIHKHSQGRADGYQKRVHHDQLVPQKKFQDTYTFLKAKYAKRLIAEWVEQTPATKHVFEDLGIAAFLMELWVGMYGDENVKKERERDENEEGSAVESLGDKARRNDAQAKFPGFVDIGCGNGLLVYILLQEGWRGWGFDARRRKTWDTFPVEVQGKLKEMILIPRVLQIEQDSGESPLGTSDPEWQPTVSSPAVHDGAFSDESFLIANHADELTIWTPLLASLSNSPFIAIPCCSHNFAGARFRAPSKDTTSIPRPTPSLQERTPMTNETNPNAPAAPTDHVPSTIANGTSPPPKKPNHNENQIPPSSTSKGKPSAPQKPPSAFASFCTYLMNLTSEIGYVPEKEMLRIPSTRNTAILGRKFVDRVSIEGSGEEEKIRGIVEREMGMRFEEVGREWERGARGLGRKGGDH